MPTHHHLTQDQQEYLKTILQVIALAFWNNEYIEGYDKCYELLTLLEQKEIKP